MSDGPHRSLPMRRCWKRVAMRGDKSAFARTEISAALIPALHDDCVKEIGPELLEAFRAVCAAQDEALFKDILASDLETLRDQASTGMSRTLIDEASRQIAAGQTGINVAIKALDCALTGRATRGAWQVEEHYLRESTAPRAHRVRDRLNDAIVMCAAAITGLAHEILNVDTGHTARQPLKREGIDDGVGLRS